MKLANKLEELSGLISKKSKDCLASIHIDAAGLIRLGETSEEMLENFNQLIIRAESMGGNIMIPTFSYTYPKKVPFSLLETPSEVGIVTEYVRKRNPLKRTADGMFSYLLFDNNQKSCFFDIVDYEPFGDNSLIGELFNSNGYICCVGDVFHNTPTEVHFIERLLQVSYRSNKTMSGEIIDRDGESHFQNILFYCRNLDTNLESDMTRLEMDLHIENYFEYWEIDGLDFKIEAVRIKNVFKLLKNKLINNPLYLCSSREDKKINWRKRNKETQLIKSEL